jgi:hypothetical protein
MSEIVQEQEWTVTVKVMDSGFYEAIRIKSICCQKDREHGKGKCTGCPRLGEGERVCRLMDRIARNCSDCGACAN